VLPSLFLILENVFSQYLSLMLVCPDFFPYLDAENTCCQVVINF